MGLLNALDIAGIAGKYTLAVKGLPAKLGNELGIRGSAYLKSPETAVNVTMTHFSFLVYIL